MQYDCCVYPYKNREKHRGYMHIEKRPHENKARSGRLQTQERCLKRNQTYWHFGLGLPASRSVRNSLLFQPPNLRHFAMELNLLQTSAVIIHMVSEMFSIGYYRNRDI